MKTELSISVSPETACNTDLLKIYVSDNLQIPLDEISCINILKRSIDARQKNILVNLSIEVFVNEQPKEKLITIEYKNVTNGTPVIIVGCGPAGMFAALKLIELGFKPVIIERGKDVKSRRRDLAAINKEHLVNTDSNYCFGEGGAGTYSDGKLYTRSGKRGNVFSILETLVAHGATKEILVDSHPHIGTNKLPVVVTNLRESILNAGGEIHFNTRVTDFIIKNNTVEGVVTQTGDIVSGKAVILATGHSARDIYYLLSRKNILIEAKPFAMGVRIEHPQSLIDSIRYHCPNRGPFLPAASYSLVEQINNRGVYSFCMCPGGFIVPAATAKEEIVVNGMSPSKRDSKFANSGMVVAVEPEDLEKYKNFGALASLKYQEETEHNAFIAGGKSQTAPAQRLDDFCNNRLSSSLPETSYQPGIISVSLNEVLPEPISSRLRLAFKLFDRKMKGYYTNDAVLIGVESRTSSPVRIPRDKETLQHPQIKSLYPCGEGAGYAGGIVSAAIDGERCAEAIALQYRK
jgi:uncharacterized protein